MSGPRSINERVQYCRRCGDDRQIGERVLIGYFSLPRGATASTFIEKWAIVGKVEPYRTGRKTFRNHVSRFTIDGDLFRPDALLWGCICADRELAQATGMNGLVTTSDGATYRVVDQPANEHALVLVECVAGDAPRHVAGRRVMMPAEQLRSAA